MVINNSRRKVIFIHIPKCGGVSIEDSIHKALGGDSVITKSKLINKPPRDDDDTCKGLKLHSTMYDYSRYFKENIDDFYIFTFIRNPWKRMVSHWEYLINEGYNNRINEKDKLTFSKFVQIYKSGVLEYTSEVGYDYYLKDIIGTKLNFVGKLENINEDLVKVGLDIKIEIKDVLHSNKTNPNLKLYQDWKDYYNPRTKDMVYDIFKEYIIDYNYDFEE